MSLQYYSSQPATACADLDKSSPATNECCARQWPTQTPRANQGISKAEPRDSRAVCNLWMNPPTSPVPTFVLKQNLSPKTLCHVTSQDESFMPDIPGYIREMVKLLLKRR